MNSEVDDVEMASFAGRRQHHSSSRSSHGGSRAKRCSTLHPLLKPAAIAVVAVVIGSMILGLLSGGGDGEGETVMAPNSFEKEGEMRRHV